MIFTSGEVQYYGCIEVESELLVLDDVFLYGESASAPLYWLLTVFKKENGPVSVELMRLYRPQELEGGALPYHAPQEVLLSNSILVKRLDDFSEKIRLATCESRRAFITRSSFSSSSFFYHTPEVYWADIGDNIDSAPSKVDKRPKGLKNSDLRSLLPEHAVLRAHAMKRTRMDEDYELPTSIDSATDNESRESKEMKIDPDLTQEESQITIDIGNSTDGIEKSRKRLRRMSSETKDVRKSEKKFEISEIPSSSPDMQGFGDPIDLDDQRDVDSLEEEIVDSSPSLESSKTRQKNSGAMWVLDDGEEESNTLPSNSRKDSDDWMAKSIRKKDAGAQKSSKKETSLFKSSATPIDTADIARTTQLASTSTRLNNYSSYAAEEGGGTVSTPPRPTMNVRSYFLTPQPTKTKSTQYEFGMSTLGIDSDEESDFKKIPSSSPSSQPDRASLPVKTWRPNGPRQTTISFAKASKTTLDSAVLSTGSLSGVPTTHVETKPHKTHSNTSSTKRKSIVPLMLEGVEPQETTQIEKSKSRSNKGSPTKKGDSMILEDSKNKKRARTTGLDSDEDEESAFLREIGFPSGGSAYKLRKLSHTSPRTLKTTMQAKKRRNEEAVEEEEEDSSEMDGFIVPDDEIIEYDDKLRFVDEEPTDTDLEGYLEEGKEKPAFVALATLDLDTAFDRYLQYLVSSVINPSFANTYMGEESVSDNYFSPALWKVRHQVFAVKDSLVASSIWLNELKTLIDSLPTAQVLSERNSEFESICKACRRKHKATQVLQLSGVPYDCEAFWNGRWIDNPDPENEAEVKTLRCGPTCAWRVLHYHQLQHLQYYLVKHIQPKVAKAKIELDEEMKGKEEMEVEDREVTLLNKVLSQESWLSELKRKIEHLLESCKAFGVKSGAKGESKDEFALFLQYDS